MGACLQESAARFVHMRLATKFYSSILAVVVLAVLSSVLAVVATWQMALVINNLTEDSLPIVRGPELRSSLLKQGDFTYAYLLDSGSRHG